MNEEKRYVIVKTHAMGVFAGTLEPESTETVKVLSNARRLWHWPGTESLRQISIEGTSDPDNCNFPYEVSRAELTSVDGFEIWDVTARARKSIESVKIWKRFNITGGPGKAD